MKAEEDAMLPLLINSLGRDGVAILDGLPDPKDSFKAAIDRFDSYFNASSSILLNRKLFFQAKQGSQETVNEFACRLRRLARDCQFSNASEMLRDVFILGVINDRLGERLLTEDAATFTFEATVSKAEVVERASIERTHQVCGNK